ncbi:MAG: tRNA 2-thiocytidine(32) synthetase TtcA [Chrysiogenales bacterium]|nr:MAG: tRNA 2-thiocytidine(32) synthetase TtcA [Chrysiogenales bacterium]
MSAACLDTTMMKTASEPAFIQRVRKTVGRAINRYDMIGAEDRVAVGLSGGKDSIVLLETLAVRRKWIPIHYEIHAIHISVLNITQEFNREYFERFCTDLGAVFHFRAIEVDLEQDPRKSPCFVCSWHRRKELFRIVSETGCNRLALGHHMDDALETLFLNMTYNGSISSMPPKLAMFNGEFDLIRPLILLLEREVERYARMSEFPFDKTTCPYGNTNRRADMKQIIGELAKMNRKAKQNLFASMSNIHRDHLPPK